MTGGGQQEDPGQQLGLARDRLEAAALEQLGQRVVLGLVRGRQLGVLDEDRYPAQPRVAAAVVEVQVAVGRQAQLADLHADGC